MRSLPHQWGRSHYTEMGIWTEQERQHWREDEHGKIKNSKNLSLATRMEKEIGFASQMRCENVPNQESLKHVMSHPMFAAKPSCRIDSSKTGSWFEIVIMLYCVTSLSGQWCGSSRIGSIHSHPSWPARIPLPRRTSSRARLEILRRHLGCWWKSTDITTTPLADP